MLQDKPHDLTTWLGYAIAAIFGLRQAYLWASTYRSDHKTGEDRRVEEKTKGYRERAETAEHLAQTREQLVKDRDAELIVKEAENTRLKVQLQEGREGEVILQSRVNTMRADLDELKRAVRDLERG